MAAPAGGAVTRGGAYSGSQQEWTTAHTKTSISHGTCKAAEGNCFLSCTRATQTLAFGWCKCAHGLSGDYFRTRGRQIGRKSSPSLGNGAAALSHCVVKCSSRINEWVAAPSTRRRGQLQLIAFRTVGADKESALGVQERPRVNIRKGEFLVARAKKGRQIERNSSTCSL